MSETTVQGLEAVAAHFNKTVRQMRNWRRAGMPHLSGDRYDLFQIEAWRAQKKGGRGPAALVDASVYGQGKLVAGGDKDYQDMRAKKAQADLRELHLRKLRGELIGVAEVEALLTPRAMIYRQGMMAFEQTLSPRLAAALGLEPEHMRVMNAVIRQVTREVLENVLRPLTLSGGQILEWEKEKVAQGGG